MAHYAKPLSLILFLILISTFLHVEARERLFFSKVTHTSTTTTTSNNAMDSKSLQLSPAPEPAPAPETKRSEPSNGNGHLSVQESDEILPTTTKTAATAATTADSTVVFPFDENEIQTEELSDRNYRKEESNELLPTTTKTGTGAGAGATTESEVVFPFDENEIQTEALSDENYKKEETVGYNGNNNNYRGGYSNNIPNTYNANGYVREKLGMSDTRFLENGKYYYNIAKSENKYYSANGYESDTGNGSIEGYDNGNGENEFDSMEEYERQQGYHPQSQGKYGP